MSSTNFRTLWDHPFQVVPEGLAERDVVTFVDRLVSHYQDRLETTAHNEALHELGLKTVQAAEQIANEIRETAIRDSERQSAEAIANAQRTARKITNRAFEEAKAFEAASQKGFKEKIADLEAIFQALKQWIHEEVQTLKELQERMPSFMSSMESFLTLVDGEIGLEGRNDGEDSPVEDIQPDPSLDETTEQGETPDDAGESESHRQPHSGAEQDPLLPRKRLGLDEVRPPRPSHVDGRAHHP